MILAIAATEIEMAPFCARLGDSSPRCRTLVTGVGPIETAVRLSRFLCESGADIEAVVQFGIGGGYLQPDLEEQPELLDICLAEREVAGDLGICLGETMDYLDSAFAPDVEFSLKSPFLERCRMVLVQLGIDYHSGTFVTVSGVSATVNRGEMLRSRWRGLCENMEGAGMARVCREFGLPGVELRCISNFVENRNLSNWKVGEACQKAADTAIRLIKAIEEDTVDE